MNLTQLMLACGEGFIFSVALTPIVRDIFRSYNVVDRPGRRKVHAYPIPRVGGIPIALAYLIAINSLRGPDSVFPVHWLQTVLSGAAIIFLIGLIDDFLNLSPVVKLFGQIAAAVVAFFNGLSIDSFGDFSLPQWLRLGVTVLWLLLTTNALNLVDGLDGLCGGTAFWATMAFTVVGLMRGNALLAYTALPLAGALLGFLVFNFNPATVFLGDSGALTLGFLLGSFGIIWTGHNVTGQGVAIPVLALSLPMLDLSLAIVRRKLRKKHIFAADRGHIHHRLLDGGFSVRKSAMILYSVSIAGGLFGFMLSYTGRQPVLRIAVLMLLVAAAIAGIRQLRYSEFEVAGRLLFRGEFQKVFAAKLRIEDLARNLEGAKDNDQWWNRLISAAREWHWIRVEWRGISSIREEVLVNRSPEWSFRVTLAGEGTLLLEGDSRGADQAPDLVALSSILHRTVKRGIDVRSQTTLS